MRTNPIAMRDVLIEEIYRRMGSNEDIMFLSADFGSPKLDKLREDYKDRFINVGIAEQNLINVSTGLALEGFIVYAYAIAPFLTMRAYEQIRNNISLMTQTKEININLIGVGAGLSYDVSGPSHHCLEDITIMRALPNVIVFSPSDWRLAKKFVDYSIKTKKPKYIRCDGKALPNIYNDTEELTIEKGFYELVEGEYICLVATGYMTHAAIKVANSFIKDNIHIGVIDVFLLKPFNADVLLKVLSKYETIITLEEAFINKGGLDSLILDLIEGKRAKIKTFKKMGIKDEHVFNIGTRQYLHKINKIDEASIKNKVIEIINEKR